MMNSVQRLATIFTLAVLILGPAYMALAEDSETTQETTLTGQLSKTDKGGYVLVEQESGKSISVRGPEELAEHVGALVKVTGQWAEDDYGTEYFAVSSVERVA